MSMLEKFLSLPFDTSSIGLVRKENLSPYFCTPRNSIIFAKTGVDGIHFCIVPNNENEDLDKSPVYVISPMMPDKVEPIAEDFKTFLDLVITVKDAGALECISHMTEYRFCKYISDIEKDVKKNNEVLSTINLLKQTFNLCEHADVYNYVKSMQNNKVNRIDEFRIEYQS